METNRKLNLACTIWGLTALLILPFALVPAAKGLNLQGGLFLLFLQLPVHLTVIASIFFLTKHTCPEKDLNSILKMLDLTATKDVTIKDTAKRFFIMFGVLIGVSLLMDAVNEIFSLNLQQQPLMQILQKGSPGTIAAIILSAVVLAPVSEELLFRGALFRLLKEILPDAREAAFLTALVFAAAHWNILRFLPLFVMSLLLQKACRETKSLLPAILMHSTNNALAILCVLLVQWAEKGL